MKTKNDELSTKANRINANLKILMQKERDAIVPEKRSPSHMGTAPAISFADSSSTKKFQNSFLDMIEIPSRSTAPVGSGLVVSSVARP
jgi:hypothetical protein